MGLTRLLLALHPRQWRERYGEEYAALIEDCGLSPALLADVLIHGAKLRLNARRGVMKQIAAVALSVLGEILARRDHLSVNILWVPRTPAGALVLAVTVGPWIAIAAGAIASKLGRGDLGVGRGKQC